MLAWPKPSTTPCRYRMRLAMTSLSTSSEAAAGGIALSAIFGCRRIGASDRADRAGEHRVQQHVRPRLEMLRPRVLDLVVTDAVLARHEDHRCRGDPRDIDRVVSRAAHHLAMRIPQSAGGAAAG